MINMIEILGYTAEAAARQFPAHNRFGWSRWL